MELEELKRLQKINPRQVLSKPVDPLGTEYDVIKDFLVGLSTIRLANREIKVPGLTRHMDLVLKAVADFKDKKKRNIMPLQYAKTDDIVVAPLRPETFDLDNFKLTGLTVGTTNILPQTSDVFSLDNDELIIITDFIEFETKPVITALQATVDGTPQKPIDFRLAVKASDLHIIELDYPLIADVSLDIDGKVEEAGNSELTPIGVHVCLGKLLPNLT